MISSSSPTSPASPPAPGQQQGAPAQAGLWCPCVVSQGRAQCSWLPAESQLGLDTAQPSWERWHSQTLQASREEMLPRQCHQPWEPTLNHPIFQGGRAVPPVILSHLKKERGTPFEAQSSSSPAQGSLGHCNAAGQAGTAQGSLLLFFVQLL